MTDEKKTILIIEDEPEFAQALEVRLQLMNFKVVKAMTATEAFQMVRESKPQLIISDINLPGLSGIDICDVLKKDAATSQIPIIFLTASSDRITELEARYAGGFSFLAKPLDPVLFQSKIREAFSKQTS